MRLLAIVLLSVLLLGCLGSPSNRTNQTGCVCTKEYSPVCGADGKTYGNPCMARCANVSVSREGECPAGCQDSDNGENILAKGVVTSGNSSYADSCAGEASVTEYFCQGDAPVNKTVDCPTGYVCKDGACAEKAQQPPPPPPANGCSDSDGGQDFAVSGSVTKGATIYFDTCTDLQLVKEYYCQDGEAKNVIHMCDSGQRCDGGRCVVPEHMCTETDDGNDIFHKGTLNSGTVVSSTTRTDACDNDHFLREYYCVGSDYTSASEECPSGYHCTNGACRQDSCDDSDGGQNRNVKGTVSLGGNTYTDFCAASSSVGEYYCSGGLVQSTTLTCGGTDICNDGRCVPTCLDSDGGNDTHTVGNTSRGTSSQIDYCTAAYTVREYFCSGNSIASADLDCGFYEQCSGGKCIPATPPCTDTDGGDTPTAQGTASNGFTSKTDYCIDASTLREYYCASPTGAPTSRDYNCTMSACTAGACLP